MRLVNDKVFKRVFGAESGKEILADLLNAILDYPEDEKITELTLMNPFSEVNYADEKTSIMDMKAKDKQGRSYNIEVQIIAPTDYVNRVVYYLSKLLSGQLKAGENYRHLTKTISISIVSDKALFDTLKNFHNIFRYKHITEDYELGDVTELHFIELTKFIKTRPEELHTKLDKWASLLKFGEMYKESGYYPEELTKDNEIAMAIEQFGQVSADERFRYYLMDIEKSERDRVSDMENAIEEGMLKGIREGMQKGIREGMQKGIREGILKGKDEGIQEGILKGKLEVASGMLANKIPKSVILQVTGLSEEDINKIN